MVVLSYLCDSVPAHIMPQLETVRTDKTSKQVCGWLISASDRRWSVSAVKKRVCISCETDVCGRTQSPSCLASCPQLNHSRMVAFLRVHCSLP